MKFAAGLALAGLASGAAVDRQIAQLRGFSKAKLINLHKQHVLAANASQVEASFAEAFAAKAKRDGVPEHVYESVVYNLANGGIRTHGEDGKVWDNCPPGKCDVPVTLAEIWGYGCWCNFPYLGRGSGPILDEFDHSCNFLSRCNRCTVLDGENHPEPYVCDAATEDFNVNVRWDMANMGLTGDCAISNDNDCDKHLCNCQMTFISKLLDYLWAGATVNPINYHGHEDWNGNRCKGGEMPTFTTVPTVDPEILTTAEVNQDTVHTEFTVDQGHDRLFICCGFYPERYSYNTDTWACCESEELRNPYRHATQECCESGEVVNSGEVCP